GPEGRLLCQGGVGAAVARRSPRSLGAIHNPSWLEEEAMASRQASPTVLLILLCVAVFLVHLAVLMLGPLLVALAHAFQTSVAIVGHLAAATAITWGIVVSLVGPLSDAYGRRHILLSGLLLMALGLLGFVLAWHYSALLICCLFTGVGAATVTPNSIAALAEVFPPT